MLVPGVDRTLQGPKTPVCRFDLCILWQVPDLVDRYMLLSVVTLMVSIECQIKKVGVNWAFHVPKTQYRDGIYMEGTSSSYPM